MGTVYYALNHERKEAFALGKRIHPLIGEVPFVYPRTFVVPALVANGMHVNTANELFDFKPDLVMGDDQCDVLFDSDSPDGYGHYIIVGSVYHNDDELRTRLDPCHPENGR